MVPKVAGSNPVTHPSTSLLKFLNRHFAGFYLQSRKILVLVGVHVQSVSGVSTEGIA